MEGADPLRILMLSHLYPNRANSMGGVFVQEQATTLRTQGVEITLISPIAYAPKVLHSNKRWQAIGAVPFSEQEGAACVYHPRMLLLPRKLLFKFTGKFYESAVKRALKKLAISDPAQTYDLIHAHVALPDGDAARRLAKRWGIPYVVTIHGQDFYTTINRSSAEKTIVAGVLREASQVIMVSTKLREIAEQAALPGLEKTVIVPNGVSLDKLYRGTSPLAKQYAGKTVLLSVGNLIPRKAHAYVLQALKDLVKTYPTLHYIIVGDGQERENLEQQALRLGIENHVDFVGRVEHALAFEYMSFCDIFVLPSWAEAFGVVYIEAMAHGKPIIGCYGEGVEDIVEETITGLLVPPQDSPALFKQISVLMDPATRTQMGEAGRKVVEAKFTWEANARQMQALYRQIVPE